MGTPLFRERLEAMETNPLRSAVGRPAHWEYCRLNPHTASKKKTCLAEGTETRSYTTSGEDSHTASEDADIRSDKGYLATCGNTVYLGTHPLCSAVVATCTGTILFIPWLGPIQSLGKKKHLPQSRCIQAQTNWGSMREPIHSVSHRGDLRTGNIAVISSKEYSLLPSILFRVLPSTRL